MVPEIEELLGNYIYEWGKDEDDDTIVVFEGWAGLTALGKAIVKHLRAADLVTAESKCDGTNEYHPMLELYADQRDLIKLTSALTACFGGKMFCECDITSEFTEPGDDGLCKGRFDVTKLIDKAGLEMGFSDTYDRCSECYTLIYTQPNGYGDHGRFRHTEEGELICRECDLKDPERYLTEYLEDLAKPSRFIRAFELPIPAGFRQICEEDTFMGEPRKHPIMFERGLHLHQRENPKSQYALLSDNGITDVLFDIETGQFDVRWSLWVRDENYEAAYDLVTTISTEDEQGPGDHAKRALEQLAMSPAVPGKVVVHHVDTSGGPTTTQVLSPEEFINGDAGGKK